MTEENKKKPYLVEVIQVYEFSPAPPNDGEKEEGINSLGYFLTFGENEEKVKKTIEAKLPPLAPPTKRYNLIVKEVQEIDGIYKLGKLGNSSY